MQVRSVWHLLAKRTKPTTSMLRLTCHLQISRSSTPVVTSAGYDCDQTVELLSCVLGIQSRNHIAHSVHISTAPPPPPSSAGRHLSMACCPELHAILNSYGLACKLGTPINDCPLGVFSRESTHLETAVKGIGSNVPQHLSDVASCMHAV